MRIKHIVAVVAASALAAGALWAQARGGGSEWLTAQGDAQRTSWIRTDAAISVDSMTKPGFELQWKVKLANQPRHLNGLAQGVTANGVTLFVPMSLVTGSSNNVYAIDNDTGYTVWQRHFDTPLPVATAACPGGITAAATRLVPVAPPAPPDGRGGGGGGGRGEGYRGSVGEPGQGVPVEQRGGGAGRAAGAAPPAAPAAPPASGARAAGAPPVAGAGAPPARGGAANAGIPGAPGGGGPGGGFGRPAGVGYVIASDGVLHVLGLQLGKDLQKPAPFLPANASWSDPIAASDTLYVGTNQRCGGAPNGVWAIDLAAENKPVVSWKTNGGSVVGSVVLATNGTLLAAIGPGSVTAGGYANAIVALDPKTLQLKDWFTDPSAEFVSAPVVFTQGDKDIVAAATRDGRVLLLDAGSLGGVNHSTPLYASRSLAADAATFAPGALATWQDMPGTRWLLVPTNGAITALKVSDDGGRLSLQPGWVSRDLVSPVTPIIVNGVVFAMSSGRAAATAGATAADVARRSSPAVLYALNGVDGKELWTSGKTITSFLPGRSFWSATGQVYVGTLDGTLYAFGFAMERK